MKNISELFYFAQKAVLYPLAPLYNAHDREVPPLFFSFLFFSYTITIQFTFSFIHHSFIALFIFIFEHEHEHDEKIIKMQFSTKLSNAHYELLLISGAFSLLPFTVITCFWSKSSSGNFIDRKMCKIESLSGIGYSVHLVCPPFFRPQLFPSDCWWAEKSKLMLIDSKLFQIFFHLVSNKNFSSSFEGD